jgi:hypothetical protein
MASKIGFSQVVYLNCESNMDDEKKTATETGYRSNQIRKTEFHFAELTNTQP